MSQLTADVDPLARPDSASAEAASVRKPTYYKGFFDAEKRKPVRNFDESPGRLLVGSMIGALPFAVLIYFIARRNARTAAGQVSKKKGVFAEAMEQVQKMMDPTGEKNFLVSVKDTKFKDVVGVPEALADVQQYVDFLKVPEKFTRLGARLPKGCLLTGQPGTGKTLLAKAVAGEADVPFFSCNGADFIEVYAGSGPKRVRELFDEAKKVAPAVIFVDEIDAVGARSNGSGAGGISGEENRTVNQLLAELDGMQKEDPIVVFAATNFPENLDKALTREGRFDRKVDIPMPDKEARVDLFTHYLRKVVTGDPESVRPRPATAAAQQPTSTTVVAPTAAAAADGTGGAPPMEVTLISGTNAKLAARLAGLTPGVSPATIATIVNEAALAAAVSGEPLVGEKHLLPAIDDVLVGKKHRNRMKDGASRRVALHEAGHALIAWMLPQQTSVIKLSITPRGHAAGFTQQLNREALDLQTDALLFTNICVMLGGRIAELTQHTTLTSGAQDDYQRATKTAIASFLVFGMSRNVGLLSFDYQRIDQGRMHQLLSERTQQMVEAEAAVMVEKAFEYSSHIAQAHREKLHALADLLFERKELLEEDIAGVLGPRPERPPEPEKLQEELEHFAQVISAISERQTEDEFDSQQGVNSSGAGTKTTQHLA